MTLCFISLRVRMCFYRVGSKEWEARLENRRCTCRNVRNRRPDKEAGHACVARTRILEGKGGPRKMELFTKVINSTVKTGASEIMYLISPI